MTAVPVHRLRILSEAFERFEGSALEMVTHCVKIGHHLQTEAEVLRVTGIEIDRILEEGHNKQSDTGGIASMFL